MSDGTVSSRYLSLNLVENCLYQPGWGDGNDFKKKPAWKGLAQPSNPITMIIDLSMIKTYPTIKKGISKPSQLLILARTLVSDPKLSSTFER